MHIERRICCGFPKRWALPLTGLALTLALLIIGALALSLQRNIKSTSHLKLLKKEGSLALIMGGGTIAILTLFLSIKNSLVKNNQLILIEQGNAYNSTSPQKERAPSEDRPPSLKPPTIPVMQRKEEEEIAPKPREPKVEEEIAPKPREPKVDALKKGTSIVPTKCQSFTQLNTTDLLQIIDFLDAFSALQLTFVSKTAFKDSMAYYKICCGTLSAQTLRNHFKPSTQERLTLEDTEKNFSIMIGRLEYIYTFLTSYKYSQDSSESLQLHSKYFGRFLLPLSEITMREMVSTALDPLLYLKTIQPTIPRDLEQWCLMLFTRTFCDPSALEEADVWQVLLYYLPPKIYSKSLLTLVEHESLLIIPHNADHPLSMLLNLESKEQVKEQAIHEIVDNLLIKGQDSRSFFYKILSHGSPEQTKNYRECALEALCRSKHPVSKQIAKRVLSLGSITRERRHSLLTWAIEIHGYDLGFIIKVIESVDSPLTEIEKGNALLSACRVDLPSQKLVPLFSLFQTCTEIPNEVVRSIVYSGRVQILELLLQSGHLSDENRRTAKEAFTNVKAKNIIPEHRLNNTPSFVTLAAIPKIEALLF